MSALAHQLRAHDDWSDLDIANQLADDDSLLNSLAEAAIYAARHQDIGYLTRTYMRLVVPFIDAQVEAAAEKRRAEGEEMRQERAA